MRSHHGFHHRVMLPTYLGVAVVIGLLPAAIAHHKGRSFAAWWLYGALLWIVAVPHAIVMKPNAQALEGRRLSQGMKRCPECAELVQSAARKCRFCNYVFSESDPIAPAVTVSPARAVVEAPPAPVTGKDFIPVAVGLLVIVVLGLVVTVLFAG